MKKALQKLKHYLGLYWISWEELVVSTRLKSLFGKGRNEKFFLVCVSNDYANLGKTFFATQELKNRFQTGFRYFLIDENPALFGSGPLKKILYRIRNNPITDLKVWFMYRFLRGRFYFKLRTVYLNLSLSDEEKKFLNGLSLTKDKVEALTYEGILIGDLLYDSYLRFYHKPTLTVSCPFFEQLLKTTLIQIRILKQKLENEKPAGLLTTYTSYINQGIISRLCLKMNIPVFALGSFNQFVTNPTPDFVYHKRNYHRYREFARQADSEKVLNLGKEILNARLSGARDPATYYMAKSAYSGKIGYRFEPKKKPRAVIFLHDFFDSPHTYGELLFPDFYEWLDFLCYHAEKSKFDFYIKPHPNAVKGNDEVIEEFRERYKSIIFLPKEISNAEILENAFDVAFTVYGTIAHELAFAKVKVVNAGVNPHVAYGFCAHPQTRDELKEWILGFDQKRLEIEEAQIQEFCGVHNFRLGTDALEKVNQLATLKGLLRILQDPEEFGGIASFVSGEFETIHQI